MLAAAIVATCAASGSALAQAEQDLAERYAPIVRLKLQEEDCGEGEPYVPTDVDAVLANPEVAFRGPWDTVNVVGVAPTADDLGRGLPGYHLDFPGDALKPGCDYELWSNRLGETFEPTMYARLVAEGAHPFALALQYWFFYPYNDFNNKHEGDWEMIQLVFDADSAQEALTEGPVRVGYSQHEGAEEAVWGDEKLELLDGTHPVVYPSAGSHANYFESSLFLGRSAAQGVGCDDTSAPSEDVEPRVLLVSTAEEAYLRAYPWLAFEGRWGEKQPSFYNGPTGPNTKPQWAYPITWADETWRDRSFAIGGIDTLGPSATAFFCTAVGAGSDLLTRLAANPLPVFLGLIALGVLVVGGVWRTEWQPGAPLRLIRRRSWGQALNASRRMYRSRFRMFAGIGLAFVPIMALAAAVQAILFRVAGLTGATEAVDETNPFVLSIVLEIGLLFAILGLAIVQAAVARAMAELDEGRLVDTRRAYRLVRDETGPLAVALGIVVASCLILTLSVIGIPIAIWLVGRWAYVAQVVAVEGLGGVAALRRSAQLIRGRWWRSSLAVISFAALGLVTGPLVGVLLLFATSASFDVVEIVSSCVYVVTMPFVAIATTYLYANLRARERAARRTAEPDVLPEEAG